MARYLDNGLAAAIAAATCLAACGGRETPDAASAMRDSAATTTLNGAVVLDGSSTLVPVAKLAAAAFQQQHPTVLVNVHSSGTGSGLRKLCEGGVDIAGASRPINAAESRLCQQSKTDYIELPVGFDSLSVVVAATNGFVDCLTVGQLNKLWEPAAQGTVTRWNQLGSSFPDEPIALFGPGGASGTFDYFTLAVNGTERSSRRDYTSSEDDTVIANGVAANANALGYLGSVTTSPIATS
jgi:phosphate transport system substrate-binding protein